VERARRGEGPAFLQCHTYRFYGHHVGDIDRSYYRSKQEEEEWKGKRDPLLLFAEWLQKSEMADRKLLDQIQNEIAMEIKEAADLAINAPYPDLDEVNQDVYA
jgi:pyruvate dehydrogenase E1 component alpha subunit